MKRSQLIVKVFVIALVFAFQSACNSAGNSSGAEATAVTQSEGAQEINENLEAIEIAVDSQTEPHNLQTAPSTKPLSRPIPPTKSPQKRLAALTLQLKPPNQHLNLPTLTPKRHLNLRRTRHTSPSILKTQKMAWSWCLYRQGSSPWAQAMNKELV
ncbi:MAG: hypothetical protein IPM76_22235 [Chloroflexi bacterium]|nr:hypothetical protein [Chloroflexota bacterium]